MKKLLIRLAILILAVLVGGGIIAYLQVNRIVKDVVESQLPMILQVPVTLEEVDLSIASGTGRLSGLTIGNPAGFESEQALVLGSIVIKLDLASVGKEILHIEEILIVSPEITVEGIRGRNLDQLIKNATSTSGGTGDSHDQNPPTTEPGEEEVAKASGRKVVIDRLILQDGQIHYRPIPGQYVSIPLPDLEMTGIGDPTGGTTLQDILVQVLRQIDETVLAAAPGAGRLAGEVARRAVERFEKKLDRHSGKLVQGIRGFLKRVPENEPTEMPAVSE